MPTVSGRPGELPVIWREKLRVEADAQLSSEYRDCDRGFGLGGEVPVWQPGGQVVDTCPQDSRVMHPWLAPRRCKGDLDGRFIE
jgi:hypothetical protein